MPDASSVNTQVAAAPAIRRFRDQTATFQNVTATGRATLEIPRYARTLQRIDLELGGTALTRAMISGWRLKLGQGKTITEGTGTQTHTINKYSNQKLHDHPSYLRVLDFLNSQDKTLGGEFVGAMDLTMLPAGRLFMEVDIAGATAPTLAANFVWSPPQGNAVIKRFIKGSGAFTVTGRNTVPISVGGADIARMFLMYNGNDWCGVTGTAAAWAGNTGNGVMGAVTVSAAAQVGVHKFVCTQANANLGTFQHQTPDGIIQSTRMIVASAYAGAGLAFTLADGATDYIPGDGFDITVGYSAATDGNITRNEFKIDGTPIFDRSCHYARREQIDNGLIPQSKVFVTDFLVDRNPEGLARTANTKSVESNWYATATDTFDLYMEVLQNSQSI